MPKISVRDNEKNIWKRTSKKNNDNKTKTEKNKWDKSYSERVRDKWFCCAFKLGFLQLICKASLVCKLKHVAMVCRCLNMWLVILFDMFHNPSFKMKTSFANIARTAASTSKFIY